MKQYHLITFCLIILLGCEVSTEKKENINQKKEIEYNFIIIEYQNN